MEDQSTPLGTFVRGHGLPQRGVAEEFIALGGGEGGEAFESRDATFALGSREAGVALERLLHDGPFLVGEGVQRAGLTGGGEAEEILEVVRPLAPLGFRETAPTFELGFDRRTRCGCCGGENLGKASGIRARLPDEVMELIVTVEELTSAGLVESIPCLETFLQERAIFGRCLSQSRCTIGGRHPEERRKVVAELGQPKLGFGIGTLSGRKRFKLGESFSDDFSRLRRLSLQQGFPLYRRRGQQFPEEFNRVPGSRGQRWREASDGRRRLLRPGRGRRGSHDTETHPEEGEEVPCQGSVAHGNPIGRGPG